MQAWYMSGAGNDFMVIDARGLALDFSSLAKRLCEEADCDGFMAVDHSAIADFKLHFYNADGSRGEMCGNGSRCVSRFAFDHGIAPAEMTIETDAGILTSTRISENQYRVQLNNPGIVDLHRHGEMAYVELGDPGVPHGVFHYPGLKWEMRDELRERMRAERFAAYFPKGANVNYYDFLSLTCCYLLVNETVILVEGLVCLSDDEIVLYVGSHIINMICYNAGLLIDLAVGSLDESVVAYTRVGGKVGNKSDVRSFRCFDRTHSSVMGVVYVTNLEGCAVT